MGSDAVRRGRALLAEAKSSDDSLYKHFLELLLRNARKAGTVRTAVIETFGLTKAQAKNLNVTDIEDELEAALRDASTLATTLLDAVDEARSEEE